MRLIDADRLKEVLDRNFSHTGGSEVMRQIIDKQPTVYKCDGYCLKDDIECLLSVLRGE